MATLDGLLDCLTASSPHVATQPPIHTEVPGRAPIELIAYYEEFRDYYPRCEFATKRWFVEHVQPDWTILDCGANIGYYTILFAQLAPRGTVIAFEPTDTHDMLLANLHHAGVSQAEVLRMAVGKHTGRMRESVFRIWGQEPEVRNYPFTTLDDFMVARQLQRIDAIKIDVDSFDFEVLQGAEELLRRFDPWVVVELNHGLNRRGQSVPEALEWMSRQGYRDCLCLDYDNYVFSRRSEFSATGAGAAPMTIWFPPSR